MSQTVVLWILGGWFVVAAVASLMIGRMISQDTLAGASESVETSAPAERQADRVARPRMAA